jgi:small-conductance mechanosensitive channel
VARQVLRDVAGGIPSFEPFIRYHTFGDSAIGFTVVLRVKEFADRYLVTHELMKSLKVRYDREGIEIPFPQRVIHRAAAATTARSRPPEGAPAERGGYGHA